MFSDVVGSMYHIPVISIGGVMRGYAKSYGYGSLSEFLRMNGTRSGFEITRKHVMDSIENAMPPDQNRCVVVDGMYDQVMYYAIKFILGDRNVLMVNVSADYDVRRARIKLRKGLKSDDEAVAEMLRRDSTKCEVGLESLTKMADITVANDLDLENLRQLARHAMETLLHGQKVAV